MSVLSSGFDLGRTARALALLEKLGVGDADFQRSIDDPDRRALVACALRGEEPILRFGDKVDSEIELTDRLCQMTGLISPGKDAIVQALGRTVDHLGCVTVHDRFIPGGLTAKMLYECIAKCYHHPRYKGGSALYKDHWDFLVDEPKDQDWERIPTVDGVLRCNFDTIMDTDSLGQPITLDREWEQLEWAEAKGGDGITSFEETLALFARSFLERKRPLWGAGGVRCRNHDRRDIDDATGSNIVLITKAGSLKHNWLPRDRDSSVPDVAVIPRIFVPLS